MSISQFEIHRYRVPFRTPFSTSHGLESYRSGLIIRLTTDDGQVGHGEAAALPAFGTGTLDEIERYLSGLRDRIEHSTPDQALELLDSLTDSPTSAPARFALDTAILDLQSREAGLPLSGYLKPDAVSSVPVNATISDMDAQRAATAASYASLAGYSAVKVKVGILQDPEEETQRVSAIRQAIGPETELRLDANGAWSFRQAVRFAERLEPFDIAYFEQPLPPGDYDGMAQLRREIAIPIAADEGATTAGYIRQIIETGAADVLILKPGIIGGLRRAREMIRLARGAGLKVVVTTALETGVAITAALHLAATLPQPVLACGLATGALLQDDLLVESPAITGGIMSIPDRPGLGVEPSPNAWQIRTDET